MENQRKLKSEPKNENRNRSNSWGPLDEFLKRKRANETSPSESEIFRRSKKVTRSPLKVTVPLLHAPETETDSETEMEAVMKKLDEMSENQDKVAVELKTLISNSNEELKQEIRNCEEKWEKGRKELEGKFSSLELRVEALEQERLAAKEDEGQFARSPHVQESQSMRKGDRRKNIIIEGLDTRAWNHAADVQKFLKEKMGIETIVTEAFPLKTSRKNAKIVLAKLIREEDKRKIMQRKKEKLEGSNIFINDDLTKEERGIQKSLREKAKSQRAAGHVVKLGHGKICIDGIWFNPEGERLSDRNGEQVNAEEKMEEQ